MQATKKLLDKRQKKNIEKREKKPRKMRKTQLTTINIFLILVFLYRKIYILLEDIFRKT